MAEVFISYSQKDRALVAPIFARLTELGVDAWYDQDLPAGESFGAIIRARLKEAKAILVCWSPEAIESNWVDAEAEYAREVGAYVPIFIAPCALLQPFNLIQTADLSNWTGEVNNSTWIQLVDRIATLIGREGVAAAARVLATGDEQARYDFARGYPDEPTARKIWNEAEQRHREHFARRMAEAKSAAQARIGPESVALEARLRQAVPVFEIWLADERIAAAKGPPPDPFDVIEQAGRGQDPRLLDEIAILQRALAQAKAKELDLEAAKTEIARLSTELAAVLKQAKERERILDTAKIEIKAVPAITRCYVSYAWADESDPKREENVDALCEEAEKRGVKIVRDKITLNHGDLIWDFMRQIGEGDRVFIFLSDAYLHSPYCMFELFEMWRNSRQNEAEFLRRARFFTLDDARIVEPRNWLEYAKFWKRARDKLRQDISELGWEFAGIEAIKRYKLIEKFTGEISDVLALFASTVKVRTFADFLEYGFDDRPEGVPGR